MLNPCSMEAIYAAVKASLAPTVSATATDGVGNAEQQ